MLILKIYYHIVYSSFENIFSDFIEQTEKKIEIRCNVYEARLLNNMLLNMEGR